MKDITSLRSYSQRAASRRTWWGWRGRSWRKACGKNTFVLNYAMHSIYVSVCVCAFTTCRWLSKAAGGSASTACQEAVADLLGLFEQLQVLLSILLRELQLWQLIFHQVDHITCAVWVRQHTHRKAKKCYRQTTMLIFFFLLGYKALKNKRSNLWVLSDSSRLKMFKWDSSVWGLMPRNNSQA